MKRSRGSRQVSIRHSPLWYRSNRIWLCHVPWLYYSSKGLRFKIINARLSHHCCSVRSVLYTHTYRPTWRGWRKSTFSNSGGPGRSRWIRGGLKDKREAALLVDSELKTTGGEVTGEQRFPHVNSSREHDRGSNYQPRSRRDPPRPYINIKRKNRKTKGDFRNLTGSGRERGVACEPIQSPSPRNGKCFFFFFFFFFFELYTKHTLLTSKSRNVWHQTYAAVRRIDDQAQPKGRCHKVTSSIEDSICQPSRHSWRYGEKGF